ncbi:hypothetical protein J6590_061217 [Homalodisca vitripennis]|nr:hypothetical protein J6590_061217 [Homalodisca vitripennis]
MEGMNVVSFRTGAVCGGGRVASTQRCRGDDVTPVLSADCRTFVTSHIHNPLTVRAVISVSLGVAGLGGQNN